MRHGCDFTNFEFWCRFACSKLAGLPNCGDLGQLKWTPKALSTYLI